MGIGLKVLAASAAMIVSTQASAALVTGQISVAGYASPIGGSNWATATGLDAVANGTTMTPTPGVPGGLTSYGAGSGSFAGLNCASVAGSCGTIADIPSFTAFSPIANFLTLLGGPSISFDLNSLTNIMQTPGGDGGSLSLSGNGIFHFAGYDNTPGVFTLTAQGTQITSFSASAIAAPVPEPATWALMLLGFGAVGYSMRRRSVAAKLPQLA